MYATGYAISKQIIVTTKLTNMLIIKVLILVGLVKNATKFSNEKAPSASVKA